MNDKNYVIVEGKQFKEKNFWTDSYACTFHFLALIYEVNSKKCIAKAVDLLQKHISVPCCQVSLVNYAKY